MVATIDAINFSPRDQEVRIFIDPFIFLRFYQYPDQALQPYLF